MRRRSTAMIWGSALLIAAGAVFAELSASFDIQPRLIRLGETARCTLTVSGANNPPKPNFPDLDGVKIRSAGRRSNFNMVNFKKVSRSVEFSYALTPTRTGEFTIGPYTYKAGGEELQLPAIELKVLDASGQDPGAGERGEQSLSDMLFARIEMPEGPIYTHQIFNISLRIFAREGLNLNGNFDPYGFPESRLNMGNFVSRGMSRVERDGAVYNLYRFSARARALSSGGYSFQPGLRAGLRVSQRGGRRDSPFNDSFFQSFFDHGRVEYVEVPVEPVKLDVLPLPSEGRPESFSGAVGDFSFSVSTSPKEVAAGEPITIKMLVEGRGNIDNITPPKLDLGDDFKSYEPRLISGDSNGGSGSARKLFEEVLVPRSDEIEAIPAIEFSFFDPVAGEYETIESGPFPIVVTPSSSEVVEISAQPELQTGKSEPEILGSDIVYLKDTPPGGGRAKVFAALSNPCFWWIQMMPILGLAILFGWQRRREFLQGNVAVARRQRAPHAARAALARAEKALRGDGRSGFFEALWEAAADYFGNRLNLAPGEVGMTQLADFLQRAGLEEESSGRLKKIIQRCEQERFAAGSGADDWRSDGEEMLADMRSILKRCERLRVRAGSVSLRLIAGFGILAVLAAGILMAVAAGPEQSSPARSFARAAEAYDAGDLDRALEEYRSLLEAGETRPQLYYNLGNTFFRMHRLGEAIRFYRKAWYLMPSDPDIDANLDLALRESGALVPELPLPTRFFTSFSGNAWLRLALSLYWICAAVLAGAILIGNQRRVLLKFLVLPVLALIFALAAVTAWQMMLDRDEAVVVGDECEALFAPIEDSTAHFTLPLGSIVSVRNETDGWRQVEIDGKSAWVPEDACRLLRAE